MSFHEELTERIERDDEAHGRLPWWIWPKRTAPTRLHAAAWYVAIFAVLAGMLFMLEAEGRAIDEVWAQSATANPLLKWLYGIRPLLTIVAAYWLVALCIKNGRRAREYNGIPSIWWLGIDVSILAEAQVDRWAPRLAVVATFALAWVTAVRDYGFEPSVAWIPAAALAVFAYRRKMKAVIIVLLLAGYLIFGT